MNHVLILTLLGCSPQVTTPAPEVAVDPTPVAEIEPESKPAIEPVITLSTTAGPLTVTPVYHGTARVDVGGVVVWLDPWSKADLEGASQADVILITDIHADHMDPEALAAVHGEGTAIVAPAAVAEALEGFSVEHILANGESVTLGELTISAEPMYNLVRGPGEGVLFHDKGRGNGYRITVGGKTIYFAGDTECTPEMKALKDIDLAFVPMNLPYTMPPEEAAECVSAFRPAVVVPYHYGDSDLSLFEAGVKESGVTVSRVEFYPAR